MGLVCSKRKQNHGDSLVRISPFSRFAHRSSLKYIAKATASEGSLVAACLSTIAATLPLQDPAALQALPPDLSQLLLDRLIDTEKLNDEAVRYLRGQQFYELRLDAYPIPIRDVWVNNGGLATEYLQVLDVSRTQITDFVLGGLPALPRCKVLKFDFCPNLTDAALTLLGRTPAVQELSLASCDALGPLAIGWIARLSHLRRLNLNACHRCWSLGPLRLLSSSLIALDLGWCNALGDEDAAALASLTLLQDLRICHTGQTDEGISKLSTLSALTSLSLGGLGVNDATLAQILPCFPNLHNLNLERCMEAGDDALRAIARAGLQLRCLHAAYTDITDDGLADALAHITSLECLTLESCSVGDVGLVASLPSLQRLTCLDISDTSMTNATLAVLPHLPLLRQLDISFATIDDKGLLQHLARCTNLENLEVDCRQISDAGLAAFTRLPRLQSLSLFGTAVTNQGCIPLAKCTSLQRLELCSGAVSDIGVTSLAASLIHLKHVSLAQNYNLSNGCIPSLTRLSSLQSLNLSHTNVSSSGVVFLVTKMPTLEVVCLTGTKVKPAAVEKMQRINKQLEVRGIAATSLY